ncbi:MAG: FAD-dependent monooxygenase [Nitrospirae bacterium]|nr:FAD-dependent monooxygenase [Nitrospirota bacterium]
MNQRSRTSNPTEPADVVIVGGGMGGLLLALILGRGGRTVTIIERQPKLQPIARGELLQPNGLRILDRLGLLDRLKTLPAYRAHRFDFHRIGGRKLCTVDYRTLPPPWNYTLITRPHHLLSLLLEQLEQTGCVRLLTETDFQELLLQHNRIIGIRAVQNGRPIELRTSLVIGSDGSYSKVRQAMGIRSHLHAYREGYLTMVVPRPPGFSNDARYYVGCGQILGLFPVSDSELYLFYMIRAADWEEIKQRRVAAVTAAIAEIDTALAESLRSVTSWDQVGYMPCVRVRAERWTANGIALIGDAAHAMNPHVAQGRNQAMEDAVVLAEVIQNGFASGALRGTQLNRYEQERRPPVERLQRMGDELTVLWNTALPPLAWFRDRIFEGMERHPEVRERVVKTISGLEIRPMGIFDRLRVFMP